MSVSAADEKHYSDPTRSILVLLVLLPDLSIISAVSQFVSYNKYTSRRKVRKKDKWKWKNQKWKYHDSLGKKEQAEGQG